MITTASASALAGSSQTFTWNNSGAAQYQLWVGTSLGTFNVGATAPGTATTATIPALPANGSTIFVRLWSKFGATWLSNDYTYVSGP